VNDQDRSGRTALHYAALASDVGEAEARLADGEDPAQVDLQGFTPLHFAAQAGSAEVALLLLKHHAPVDQANKFRPRQQRPRLLRPHKGERDSGARPQYVRVYGCGAG
jgi:ankyrin repeat protein